MKINSTATSNNVNFTSVVPLKVFIDGLPSTDTVNIKKAVVAASRILTHPPSTNQKFLEIIKKFVKYDMDFSFPSGSDASGSLLRNAIEKGRAYLFTGEHARILDDLGKKIGPAKAKGISEFSTSKTFEVKALANEYFSKIRAFLSYPKIRLKESINPKTRIYEGQPLELHIHAKSSGKMGQKGFKLKVDDITFETIKK